MAKTRIITVGGIRSKNIKHGLMPRTSLSVRPEMISLIKPMFSCLGFFVWLLQAGGSEEILQGKVMRHVLSGARKMEGQFSTPLPSRENSSSSHPPH